LALSFASSRTLAKLKLDGALRGAPKMSAEANEGSEKVTVMASGAVSEEEGRMWTGKRTTDGVSRVCPELSSVAEKPWIGNPGEIYYLPRNNTFALKYLLSPPIYAYALVHTAATCQGYTHSRSHSDQLTVNVFVHRRVLELLLVLGKRKQLLDVLGREPVLEVLVQLLLQERRALVAAALVSCMHIVVIISDRQSPTRSIRIASSHLPTG
jgi:hypothetical protein